MGSSDIESPVQSRESSEDLGDDLGVRHAASHADHDVRRRVVPVHVLQKRVACNAIYRLRRPAYVAPQRVARPEHFVDQRVHAGCWVVVNHRQLFVDDVTLVLDVIRTVQRVSEHVEEQFEAVAKVWLGDLAPEGGNLVLGTRVENSADALDLGADLHGIGTRLGALEHHVLDEVGHPRPFVRLVSGADADEDGNRDRPRMWHVARHDPQAVVERSLLVNLRGFQS